MSKKIHEMTRRDFTAAAMMTGAALAVPLLATAAEAPKADGAAPAPKWLNEPRQWKHEGQSLVCTADPKTDFWRKTLVSYINDNGHFFHKPATGDFTMTAKVTGQYHDLYDQAGLMVRWDESNWMKCGFELVEGARNMGVVVTRDFSDGSSVNLGAHDGPLWLRIVRRGSAFNIFHSTNGKDFVEDRLAYLTPAPTLEVGLMCAAPIGKGFEVRFDDWRVEPAKQ